MSDRLQQFMKLVEDNRNSPQKLERRPEPESVTDEEPNVAQYNRVLNTNMTANYAVSMDLIHRSRADGAQEKVLDLCSGPGFVSLCLAKHLGYKQVSGRDLSAPMVRVARENAKAWDLGKHVDFEVQNVLKANPAPGSYDLVSFTNSAHHLPYLKDVRQLMQSCDHWAKPEGVVVLTDIGRLKTADITDRFVNLAGEEFIRLGMPDMFEDFRNSMYAGWTADEIASCVPEDTERVWVQMIPTGLSNYHALIGLPVGRTEVFVRPSLDWPSTGFLKSPEAQSDWHVMKQIVETAEYHRFLPKQAKGRRSA